MANNAANEEAIYIEVQTAKVDLTLEDKAKMKLVLEKTRAVNLNNTNNHKQSNRPGNIHNKRHRNF